MVFSVSTLQSMCVYVSQMVIAVLVCSLFLSSADYTGHIVATDVDCVAMVPLERWDVDLTANPNSRLQVCCSAIVHHITQ